MTDQMANKVSQADSQTAVMTDLPDWLAYEKAIFEYLRLDHPEAEVVHNASLPGCLSGVPRQIDVLVTERFGPKVYVTAFEAKHYTRKIDVKGVEEAM